MALVVPTESVKLPHGFKRPMRSQLKTTMALLREQGMIVPLIVNNMEDRIVDELENWSAHYLCAAIELEWPTVIIDIMEDDND